MEELLRCKLKEANKFKELTQRINELSIKTEHVNVDSLIEERQGIIDNIDKINLTIKEEKSKEDYVETEEIKRINKEISRVFVKAYEIDNQIRKNINNELKTIKKNLNHPDANTMFNIKI
jgi:hypothetical protein